MEMTSFSHSYGQSAYHIVLVPYKRRSVFGVPGLKERIEQIFQCIADKYKFVFYALKVKRDHVHMFVSFPPSRSLSEVFHILKGLSTNMFFKDKPGLSAHFGGKLWSEGKFFRSVGPVNAETVEYYINNQ